MKVITINVLKEVILKLLEPLTNITEAVESLESRVPAPSTTEKTKYLRGDGTWADGVQGPKGDKGDTGPAGPTGPTGATGPQGPTGATGAKGDKGADGATPTIGSNGNWYINGTDTQKPSRGATGAQGPKGDTGAQGPTGKTGAVGATGPQGPKGADGVTPTIGDNGNWYINGKDTSKPSRGATGATGAQGSQGPQGPKGDQGAQGAAGAKGDKGATGTSMRNMGEWKASTKYVNDSSYIDIVTYNGSAYACKTSHTSSSTWASTYWTLLVSKGDTGPQGKQGPTGAAGAKGDTGNTGPAGATGAKGDKGDSASGSYGTCSTAAATAAKTVSITGYKLVTGNIVTVKFTYAVPASATLNITGTGAKNIYHKGAAIAANVINAGDTATFIYNGQYHLIAIDYKVDTALNSSSLYPLQNKVIYTELGKKAGTALATTSANGLMSAADKQTLSRIFANNNMFEVNSGKDNRIALYTAGDSRWSLPNNATLYFDFGDEEFMFDPTGLQMWGKLSVNGKVLASGSDYAKYYEWTDGNTENEDRRGLFVALDGEKIRVAKSADDFVLGVVSAAPGFIENAYETEWQGKYVKDVYGERIVQTVEAPESADADGNAIPATIKTEYVVNPEYNADEEYIPRSQRSEWTCVGLIGEIVVIDDGTCEINGYCKPAEGGIATKADTGYRVLARLDDTHIKILIK